MSTLQLNDLMLIFGESSFWASLPKTPRGGLLGKALAIGKKTFDAYKTPPEVTKALELSRDELGKLEGKLTDAVSAAEVALQKGLADAMQTPATLATRAQRLTLIFAQTKVAAESESRDARSALTAKIQLLENDRVVVTVKAFRAALIEFGLIVEVAVRASGTRSDARTFDLDAGIEYTGLKKGGKSFYASGVFRHELAGKSVSKSVAFASATSFGKFAWTLHNAITEGKSQAEALEVALQAMRDNKWDNRAKNAVNSTRNQRKEV